MRTWWEHFFGIWKSCKIAENWFVTVFHIIKNISKTYMSNWKGPQMSRVFSYLLCLLVRLLSIWLKHTSRFWSCRCQNVTCTWHVITDILSTLTFMCRWDYRQFAHPANKHGRCKLWYIKLQMVAESTRLYSLRFAQFGTPINLISFSKTRQHFTNPPINITWNIMQLYFLFLISSLGP